MDCLSCVVGPVRVGRAHAQDTTKETVLRWVETFRSATPEFQAGETLKLGDLENVHPFLPPGYVEEYNFPDVEFAITQTGDYPPHPAYHAATEKFAGQTRLATDGALENYIGRSTVSQRESGYPGPGVRAESRLEF